MIPVPKHFVAADIYAVIRLMDTSVKLKVMFSASSDAQIAFDMENLRIFYIWNSSDSKGWIDPEYRQKIN